MQEKVNMMLPFLFSLILLDMTSRNNIFFSYVSFFASCLIKDTKIGNAGEEVN